MSDESSVEFKELGNDKNKIVRVQEPFFGSIIPHVSKNQVNASKAVQMTKSVALQPKTSFQTYRNLKSTVHVNRSLPRGTTMSYGEITREGSTGNYLTAVFRQSSIELQRVPLELQLSDYNATDMGTLINRLEHEY